MENSPLYKGKSPLIDRLPFQAAKENF